MNKIFFYFCTGCLLISSLNANTRNDPHLPLSHCYHWLDSNAGYLDFKYDYASRNNGALTFYTTAATSNGSIAGPGLYCAKSPSGSYSYGDRVIRIDFSDDVVVLDEYTGKKHCGHNGDFYADQSECDSKDWDVKFYSGGGVGSSAWYVISNPNAITSWSATSDQLISDLNLSKTLNGSNFQSHADATLQKIQQEKASHPDVTYNSDARIGILSMIEKKPELLKTIPRMHLLKTLTSSKIPDEVKEKVDQIKDKVISEIILDELLNMKDYEDLFKNPSITQAVLTQTYKMINNGEQINISLFNVFMNDYVEKISKSIDKEYMKLVLKNSFLAHPDKVAETIEYIESIGSFFEDKNRVAYKSVFEDSFSSILMSMTSFPEDSFESIIDYIGFDTVMKDGHSAFRESLLNMEQGHVEKLPVSDKVKLSYNGSDYFISKISNKEMHRSCKTTLFSLASPKKVFVHAQRGVLKVTRKRMRGLKDIDIMCETIMDQIKKFEYQAMCSVYTNNDYKAAGMVSGRTSSEIIQNCNDLLTKKKMQTTQFRLKDFTSKMTGMNPRYSADCHVDDDTSFDAYQNIIGKVYGDNIDHLNQDCKDFASAYFSARNSAALMNIHVNRRQTDNVAGTCLIDFENNFNFRPIDTVTVYGSTTRDIISECTVIKDIMENSFNRGNLAFTLDGMDYKDDLDHKAICRIKFSSFEHEFEIQSDDASKLDSLCSEVKDELHIQNATYNLVN